MSDLPPQFKELGLYEKLEEVVEGFFKHRRAWRDIDMPERDRSILVARLTEKLREYLADRDDEYVEALEEENERLEMELSEATSQGYVELKNDIRWKEALVAYLLYLYNDGETLSVDASKVESFEDVDIGFEPEDEDRILIVTEENEE